jgi:putative phosphoesterase
VKGRNRAKKVQLIGIDRIGLSQSALTRTLALRSMQQWPFARSVAILADTHGLVRDSVLDLLSGVDLILHAGDVGKPEVLDRLRACAPVVAVRGNVDTDLLWLPQTEVVSINNRLTYLLHNIEDLDLNPAIAGFAMVVSGHSHRPLIRTVNGVLYVNPGSIGPRRFKLPISLAFASFDQGKMEVRPEELAA